MMKLVVPFFAALMITSSCASVDGGKSSDTDNEIRPSDLFEQHQRMAVEAARECKTERISALLRIPYTIAILNDPPIDALGTPLQHAVGAYCVEGVRQLLEAGSDPFYIRRPNPRLESGQYYNWISLYMAYGRSSGRSDNRSELLQIMQLLVEVNGTPLMSLIVRDPSSEYYPQFDNILVRIADYCRPDSGREAFALSALEILKGGASIGEIEQLMGTPSVFTNSRGTTTVMAWEVAERRGCVRLAAELTP